MIERVEPYRIVILGGGTAGWMTAAMLASRLNAEDYRITVVESEQIGTVGVGEATLPHIKQFNDALGIDEAEFVAATQATFKLGIEFVDWRAPGHRYIHPFGAFGEPWRGVEFQHHWLRLRAQGRAVEPLSAYSCAVVAAENRKFEHPSKDPQSVRSTFAYAYHFDAGLYAAFLSRWTQDRGVARVEGVVEQVNRDAESGEVVGLRLQSGETVRGDFFVDCSGFRSLLLGETLGVDWRDWSAWLPCDRALAAPSARAEDFTPFTRSTAQAAGWTWRIPLQHRTGNGYVYSSHFCDEAEAEATLLAAIGDIPLASPRPLRFQAGRRAKAWVGNCAAIGLAGGFLEPLESTSIFLIQAAAHDLATLMPTRGSTRVDPRLSDEFNRLFEIHYERARDFLILHYVANRREGEPLWDYVRHMDLPDSLRRHIAGFEARGALPTYQLGLFSRDSWLAVMAGQGLAPRAYDPLADAVETDEIDRRLKDFSQRISSEVATMSAHAAFVTAFGVQAGAGR
ncbi:tryptophan halogenase family protein [Brevundimonas sp.]|uniref:tryptophan halogenase family protein n=1 Tax=Brevundimonas sp. TaxID=1871086 RepID=UPI0028992F39|nr:tryptophan halogenase family protein [Brevundimonas sp.]